MAAHPRGAFSSSSARAASFAEDPDHATRHCLVSVKVEGAGRNDFGHRKMLLLEFGRQDRTEVSVG
jgi:hypothetical protein